MSKSEGTGYSVQGAAGSPELGAGSAERTMSEEATPNLVQIEEPKPRAQSAELRAQDGDAAPHADVGKKLTLDEVRAKLANQKGPRFWRSVDELADAPEFAALVNDEFPSQASEWLDPVSRRSFLKVMGASMALAGLAGCTKQPDEAIMPYVKAPADLILGKPVYFASAFPFTTGAVPVLIKSAAYRPIKVDGNPEHPYNRGGAGADQERGVSADQGGWESGASLYSRRVGPDHAGDAAGHVRS